jgi:hypothetical protein
VLTVEVELDGDEEKISLEEFVLIEAQAKELLRDMRMLVGNNED